MAKMGEGEYYYYLPHSNNNTFGISHDKYYICKRDAPHPNFTVIVEQVSQDNASLIVDALNFHENNNYGALKHKAYNEMLKSQEDGTKKSTS